MERLNDTIRTAADGSLAHAPGGADSRRAVLIPFAALVLAMLPAVLDQTILATALPTVAADLGSLDDVSWLVTVYVVAATASMPLWGKLGDRHGHKRLLELSLIAFVIASTACAAVGSIGGLIAARGVQGAAAGGLMTLAVAAVGDLVAPRERGRYQGYIAATFAGATVVGPLLGGVLVDVVSWRWVFLVNLPVGIAALIGLAKKLPAGEVEAPRHGRDLATTVPAPDVEAPRHRRGLVTKLPAGDVEAPRDPLDLLGAALVAGASAALMLVCVWGGDRYAWDSAPIIALGVAAIGLAVALVLRERRVADPVVPLALLATPVVAIASGALFLATASLFAVTVFVPLFMQAAVGLTPTEAGLLLVPMMAGTTASTTFAGRAMARTGRYKRYPIAGLGLMAGALALLAATAAEQSVAATAVALAIFGVGFGMVTQILMVAVQNGVERRRLGTATAAAGFFRALGGAVGAAVLGAVFAAQAGLSASSGVVGQLDAAARDSIADAAGTVFAVATPIALLALLVALKLPEVPLAGRVR